MSDDIQYCAIPIDSIIKMKGDVPFSVYLKLADGKYVKVGQQSEAFQEEIAKYRDRGMTQVYADKIEFTAYLRSLKIGQLSKVGPNEMENLDAYFQLAKVSLVQMGETAAAIEISRKVLDKSFAVISSCYSVFDFFHQYRQSCGEHFLQNILVAYYSSAAVDRLDWGSVAIKEKMNLAAMLRDIFLTEEEAEELKLYSGNKEELSEGVLNHPQKLAEHLLMSKSNDIPAEVITIVAQHHEEPDGTGFPNGLKFSKINQLSALHIVVDRFVTMMSLTGFDRKKVTPIMSMIENQYGKGPFSKAVEALQLIVLDPKKHAG